MQDVFSKKIDASILLVALVVLGRVLMPGYILLLDLPWTPVFPVELVGSGISNSILIYSFLNALTSIFNSWFIQKVFLIELIYLLVYIPYNYIPYVSNKYSRFFVATLYILNPFVYGRIVSGQWFHLVGYALLPLLLNKLSSLDFKEPKKFIMVGLILSVIAVFSIHIFYLSAIFVSLWILSKLTLEVFAVGRKSLGVYAKSLGVLVLTVLVLCSYWIIPALMRDAPLESRFDVTHFELFAAAPNGDIPIWLNILGLGGFWGENLAWKYYYLWPQQNLIFWIALAMLLGLVLVGFVSSLFNKKYRNKSILFLFVLVLSYITALGLSNTVFYKFNYFLYKNIPFWSGLRDSHKIVSYLALMYAVLSGLGMDYIINFLNNKIGKYRYIFIGIVLCIPFAMGMYMLGGFWGQIKPVQYPSSWYEVQKIVDKLPDGEKVLVLPWHSYISLSFNNNVLVSNPAKSFFGNNRVIVSRAVNFDTIKDQEVDKDYSEIDEVISNSQSYTKEELSKALKKFGVEYIIYIVNPSIPNSEKGLTNWTEFNSTNGEVDLENYDTKTWSEMLDYDTEKSYISSDIILNNIDYSRL